VVAIAMMRLRILELGLLLCASQLVSAIDPIVVLLNKCNDIQPRYEIRELAQNQDQWNVFLLGLKHMQEADFNDPTSYWAMASMAAKSGAWTDLTIYEVYIIGRIKASMASLTVKIVVVAHFVLTVRTSLPSGIGYV
jgi:hypothetical protein